MSEDHNFYFNLKHFLTSRMKGNPLTSLIHSLQEDVNIKLQVGKLKTYF